MKKSNYQPGPRGINLANGTTLWVNPGQEVTLIAKDKDGKQHVEVVGSDGETDKLEIKGSLPDFGKASDQAEKDADRVSVLEAENAELRAKLEASAKPPAQAARTS